MIRRIAQHELEREPQRLHLARGTKQPARPLARADRRAALAGLLQDELTLAPERIVRLCVRELARFAGATRVSVRAHPSDCELLARELERDVVLIEDASLTRGGCLLFAESGEVDARVETRVERMLALLLEEER